MWYLTTFLQLILAAGILRNAESCQGIICGKSSAEHSANYPLLLFRIPQQQKFCISADLKTTLCSHRTPDVKPMHSSVWRPTALSFRVLCGPFAKEQSSLLQFRLTSKSFPHSKCHLFR